MGPPAGPDVAAGRAWCADLLEVSACVRRAHVRAEACHEAGAYLVPAMEAEADRLVGELEGEFRALGFVACWKAGREF